MVDQTFANFTSFLLVWFSLSQGVWNKDHLFYFNKHAFKKHKTQNAKKIKKNESKIARLRFRNL